MVRSKGRTVFIYAKGDDNLLGGLVNTKGVTNKNFYAMIEILLVFESTYSLALGGVGEAPRDDAEIKPGNYYVEGKFTTHAHS